MAEVWDPMNISEKVWIQVVSGLTTGLPGEASPDPWVQSLTRVFGIPGAPCVTSVGHVYSGVCSPFQNGKEHLKAVTMSHPPLNPRAEHKVGGQFKNVDDFQVPKAQRPQQVKTAVTLQVSRAGGKAGCPYCQRLRAIRQ